MINDRKKMFDLNGKEFQGNTIFNGGDAGLVKNVDVTIEEKQGEGNTPDYKLIATDNSGAKINQGFYYFSPNPQKSDEDNQKYEKMQVGRVVHIAKAVVGDDYKFPAVNSSKEAFDVLFKIVKENCANKKFNVFCTYGTNNKPSKYLGLRYFDFIEAATENSRFKVKASDLMARPVADNDSDTNGIDELSTTKESPDKQFTI